MKTAFFFAVLLGIAVALPPQSSFVVNSLPGFSGTIPFKLFSGYLPANDGQKQMFFLFAESQNDPANDPVVLWLNGGPGCSSFDGFIYEHGPFTFVSGGTGPNQVLSLNPYSWNKVANVIYLDSPCGVGLSYSTNQNDYNTDDKVTAHDSQQFLLNFFTVFNQYQSNHFFVSGESYAGVYVPTLAQQVVLGNQQQNTPTINIKGILVGNGVTDQEFDGNAFPPFVHGHALIPDTLWVQLEAACGPNYWNASGNCADLINDASNLVSGLNVYNIYADCYQGNSTTERGMEPLFWVNAFDRVKQKLRDGLTGDVPCIDASVASAYLNQDSVRTALHAIPVAQQQWTICSDLINYQTIYTTVIPVHKFLLQNNLRILVYSGDTDMCVPFTGSQAWTDSLNLPLVNDWSPWMVNNQVAGYVKDYGVLRFATIKGAGHTVPQYKPPQALHFFTKFIADQPF